MTGNRALSKASPTGILDFWRAAFPDRRFEKDGELDAEI